MRGVAITVTVSAVDFGISRLGTIFLVHVVLVVILLLGAVQVEVRTLDPS